MKKVDKETECGIDGDKQNSKKEKKRGEKKQKKKGIRKTAWQINRKISCIFSFFS